MTILDGVPKKKIRKLIEGWEEDLSEMNKCINQLQHEEWSEQIEEEAKGIYIQAKELRIRIDQLKQLLEE